MSQTENKTITPGRRFWLLLRPDKSEISALYIYAIFNGLIYLALPLGIQSIINFIQGGQVSTSWIILTSFVLAAVFLSGLMSIYQMRITENIEQKIFSRASFEFAYRLPRLVETVKKKFYLPELANRFVETVSLQKGITKILVDFSSAIVQIAFGILVLSFYHPFFIIYIAFSFAVIYILFRFTVQRGLQTSLEESKHKYKLIFWLQEVGRVAGSFKSAGYPEHPLNKTNDHVNHYIDAREKHFNILKRQYWLLVIFKVLIIGGLLLIGGLLVIQQQMNIGQFVAAEIIILLMMSSVEKLILTMRNIYDVLTALEKIGFVTDMQIENPDSKIKMEFCDSEGAELTVENLVLQHNESDKNEKIVYNLNAGSGSKVILQGKNEDNREMLFHVLAGDSDNYSGLLKYCGISVRAVSYEQMKSKVGVYSGQETIFNGTILENITLGRPGIELKEALKAARAVHLDSIIQNFENGYHTLLSVNGVELSSSTRKKILLARALVHYPKLLAVNLDALPEDVGVRQKISRMISSLKNCTVVVSTKDIDLVKGSKTIIDTDTGTIKYMD